MHSIGSVWRIMAMLRLPKLDPGGQTRASPARYYHNKPQTERMRSAQIAIVSIGFALAVTGCSEQPQTWPPTEQEVHAGDSDTAGSPLGRHLYKCDDDRALIVDFKDKGLQLDLRNSITVSSVTLRAPAQGLQYVGDTLSATFRGDTLVVDDGSARPRICTRTTRR